METPEYPRVPNPFGSAVETGHTGAGRRVGARARRARSVSEGERIAVHAWDSSRTRRLPTFLGPAVAVMVRVAVAMSSGTPGRGEVRVAVPVVVVMAIGMR